MTALIFSALFFTAAITMYLFPLLVTIYIIITGKADFSHFDFIEWTEWYAQFPYFKAGTLFMFASAGFGLAAMATLGK